MPKALFMYRISTWVSHKFVLIAIFTDLDVLNVRKGLIAYCYVMASNCTFLNKLSVIR